MEALDNEQVVRVECNLGSTTKLDRTSEGSFKRKSAKLGSF